MRKCAACRGIVGGGFAPCETCFETFCSSDCRGLHYCTVKLQAAIRQCDRVHEKARRSA
jgi:hypothetical protein